jgi:hypothetical protein
MGFLIQTTEIHLLKTSDIPSSDTFQIIPHSGNGQIIPIAQFIGHRFKLKLCTLVHFALASKNVSFDGCQSSERMDIALPD